MSFRKPIRIDKKFIFKRKPVYSSLIASYVFDSLKFEFDQSGHSKHATFIKNSKEQVYKPSIFRGFSYYSVNDDDDLNKLPLTFAFRIKIFNRKIDSDFNCVIILKGEDDFTNNELNRFPGIFFEEKSGKIIISMNRTDGEQQTLKSLSSLKPNTEHSIVINLSQTKFEIFINGILDAVKHISMTELEPNSMNLFIGNHPSYLFSCKIPFELKSLSIYNKPLDISFIEAEAFSLLGSFIEPSYIILGCMNCDYLRALESCPENYHLCLNIEFFSGVHTAAIKMGWEELSDSR